MVELTFRERLYIQRYHGDKMDSTLASDINRLRGDSGEEVLEDDIRQYRLSYPEPMIRQGERLPVKKTKGGIFRLLSRVFGSVGLAIMINSCEAPKPDYINQVNPIVPENNYIVSSEFPKEEFRTGLWDSDGVSWGIRALCDVYGEVLSGQGIEDFSLVDGALLRADLHRALVSGGPDSKYIKEFFSENQKK